MKKIGIIFSFLPLFIVAQEVEHYRRFSLGLNANHSIAMGDNVLHKGYKDGLGFGISAQYNLIKNIYFELNYKEQTLNLTKSPYVGNFNYVNYRDTSGSIGYKHFFKSTKFYSEYRLGIGAMEISHKGTNEQYTITGNSFILASKLVYKKIKGIELYTDLEFSYIKHNSLVTGTYKDFYTNTYRFVPTFGIRIPFGKLINN